MTVEIKEADYIGIINTSHVADNVFIDDDGNLIIACNDHCMIIKNK